MTGLELTHLAVDNANRLRIAQGRSIADLARSAGIGREYLSLLCNVHGQDRVISLHLLGRLAAALDVPPAELLRSP